jgi:hypothetical protein
MDRTQKTMEKARVTHNKPVRYNKVVVTGVSDQGAPTGHSLRRRFSEDELKEEAWRISSDGSADEWMVLSRTLLQWYSGTSTTRRIVKFGYRCYRTRSYVPDHLQCHRCLQFGYTNAKCRATTARCSAAQYEFDNCTVRDDRTKAKRVNCGGNNGAKYRGCSSMQ